jgi:predicted metalloendopeptidase
LRLNIFGVAAALVLAACSTDQSVPAAPPAPAAQAPESSSADRSGIDSAYIDPSVRPQDDLYRYFNGKWLESFQMPVDKGTYGAFTFIDDQIQEQLRGIVDNLARTAPSASSDAAGVATPDTDADARKIADLYASFMDEARLEALGLAPLKAAFAEIDALHSRGDIAALIARFNRTATSAPCDIDIDPDRKDSTRYAVSIAQSGLGLPDRDYYLKDDAKLKDARTKYLAHMTTMLGMAGDAHPERSAAGILALESAMAALQWTRVENRDPVKTYNKYAIKDLGKLMPRFDWKRYLAASGFGDKVDDVIIVQPSYFAGLDKLIQSTPLPVWKSYFKWHELAAAAPYLSKVFVDERFAFTGTVLNGIPENRPRWKRGLGLVNGAIGEAIGRLYVEKYFPPQHKARMEELVRTLLEAYRLDIGTLDWMGPETRKGALEKLDKLSVKIGYPNRWRDYGTLKIVRDDLWGNVLRADEFEYQRNIDKLGKPIDHNEWGMTPQTVNAYYNPVKNEIVFPAAILRPPFFDATADDAVNYGGIVAVIGHEVSHGFDDKGSQYDADGNLRDWFTKEDHERFAAKTKALVAQYAVYEPVPGYHVNGELTLGENIADNSGLTLAYKAYQLSLAGKPAAVIDGLSGDQRFYFGWVQVWRGKVRENEQIRRIKTDPHSPPAVRGTAPVKNQPGLYTAFGLKPGDGMYLAPEQRVLIW